MLFEKGFGDGAKSSAQKHPQEPDYMTGWEAGRLARAEALFAYIKKHDLPMPNILRADEPTGVKMPRPNSRIIGNGVKGGTT